MQSIRWNMTSIEVDIRAIESDERFIESDKWFIRSDDPAKPIELKKLRLEPQLKIDNYTI